VALIHCPECAGEVSDKALACPRCGYPISRVREFFRAALEGKTRVLRDLLKNRIDPNSKDATGNTALMIASYLGHDEVVRVLIRAGANVNQKRAGGNTALMDAVYRAHPRIVQILVQSGADIRTANDVGTTALQMAQDGNYPEIVDILNGLPVHTPGPFRLEQLLERSRGQRTESHFIELHCVDCHGEISPETILCPHCGVPILRRYCGGCGKLIPDSAETCPYCGVASQTTSNRHSHAS